MILCLSTQITGTGYSNVLIESRIWREKIMLIYHVSHMEEGDLAKEMMEEQVSNNWPGLVKEVEKLCNMLQIEDPKVV